MAKLVRVVGERIVAVEENEAAGTIAEQVARDQAARAAPRVASSIRA